MKQWPLFLIIFLISASFALADIPVNMTSNSAPAPYVVTSGAGANMDRCYMMFDGNDGTGVVGTNDCQIGNNITNHVTVDLGANWTIDNYTLYSQYTVASGVGTTNWTIQGSLDGITYTSLQANNTLNAWTTKRTYPLTAATYRYLRITNLSAGNDHIIQTLSFGVSTPPSSSNITIQVNDTRTNQLVSGFNYNLSNTTTTWTGYCTTTNCTNLTNITNASLTITNISGGLYFTAPIITNISFLSNNTATTYTAQTYANNLTINLTNAINGSSITTFCVNISNTSATSINCTTTNTLTFTNIIGTLTVNYYNITNYFNTSFTINNFNATNANYTNSTYQALINITAHQLFTNDNITTFNATNGLFRNSTGGTKLIIANNGSNNLQIDTPGNFSRNITCTVTTPYGTTQCDAPNISDSWYSFTANDTYNNAAINNFTLIVTNTSLGGTLYNTSTTNGSLNLSVLQRYTYTVIFTSMNLSYENKTIDLPSNASNHRYTFQVLPSASINVTIRDASTGALILQNITLVLSSNTSGVTNYTVSGGYFFTNLNLEVYSIKISGTNYSQNQYTVTPTTGAVNYLTAYLQQNATDVIMQFVDSVATSQVIAGALITQQRIVNGTWATISTRTTDITGRTVFGYLTGTTYRFIAIASGYITKQFDLDPVLFSTYTINLQRSTGLTFSPDYESIYVKYDPTLFYDNRQNNLTIIFDSPLGTFTTYNYTVTYPGGQLNGVGTNIIGETFSLPFNTTGATILDRVNITLGYDTSISSPKTFSYTGIIIVNPGNNTFISSKDNTYGMGILERILIGTIALIVIVGMTHILLGGTGSLVVTFMLFGLYIYMGLWPWWSIGISLLVGFALLIGRTP